MTPWVPITTLYFCDGPRVFHLRHGGRHYLFNCLFDEPCDDYRDEYEVLLLPPGTRDEDFSVRPGEWVRHAFDRWVGMAVARLGTVTPTRDRFDPAYQLIDAAILEEVAGPAVRLGEPPDRG